jgi:lipopolysaccharide transport system permease protein
MAGILNEGSQAFISAEGMIKQIALPKSVYVVRVVWKNLIVFGHNLVILPFVYLIVGFDVNWSILLWPLGLILTTLAISGLAVSLAVVSTRFRDLPQIVSAILSVAFYLTPIIWGIERAPSSPIVDSVLIFNPFAHILQVSRLPLIGEIPSILNYLVVSGLGLLTWGLALVMYRKFRDRIAYWV